MERTARGHVRPSGCPSGTRPVLRCFWTPLAAVTLECYQVHLGSLLTSSTRTLCHVLRGPISAPEGSHPRASSDMYIWHLTADIHLSAVSSSLPYRCELTVNSCHRLRSIRGLSVHQWNLPPAVPTKLETKLCVLFVFMFSIA